MLHLLTPRALARAPARAFVSATTLVALVGAGLLAAAPARRSPEPPDLALVTTSPAPTTDPTPISTPAPRPASSDLTCLAKAVYYEARGESEDGQAAVAQVVLNRTLDVLGL